MLIYDIVLACVLMLIVAGVLGLVLRCYENGYSFDYHFNCIV